MLSNRVCPSPENKAIKEFRPLLHTAVARSLGYGPAPQEQEKPSGKNPIHRNNGQRNLFHTLLPENGIGRHSTREGSGSIRNTGASTLTQSPARKRFGNGVSTPGRPACSPGAQRVKFDCIMKSSCRTLALPFPGTCDASRQSWQP